ncbi:hypothetical protein ACTA71_002178 [Dictyostelium dimigraforme]
MSIPSGAVAGIIIGVILLLLIWILYVSIYVVQQSEGIVIERLGRFHRVLDSGINFVMPFIDQPRNFTWRKTYITTSGTITDEVKASTRIDLRESVFNFLKQEVYTKDTVLLDVHAIMFYKIFDIKKAIYEVEDLQGALSNTSQTQIKEVFGNMTFSQALESQTQINDHLGAEFSKLFSGWGVVVERMELLDLSPKAVISEAMKKQMVAERKRRGDFIKSEGDKCAQLLLADGKKTELINLGIAEQESTRKISEGTAEATVELAQAESASLEYMQNVLHEEGGENAQINYMISLKYLDTLEARKSIKVLHVPFKIDGIQSILDDFTSPYQNLLQNINNNNFNINNNYNNNNNNFNNNNNNFNLSNATPGGNQTPQSASNQQTTISKRTEKKDFSELD